MKPVVSPLGYADHVSIVHVGDATIECRSVGARDPIVDEPTLRGQFGNGAQVVNVPRVGHMLCVEHPAAVADAVLSFLRS